MQQENFYNFMLYYARPLELKRSHDRQKFTGGLRGRIDATAHALRVIDVHTVYSAQPIYTLDHAIASTGKVKKLRIGK